MPAINTGFEPQEEKDPFIVGYEKLERKSKGKPIDFVSKRSGVTALDKARDRIAGIAHVYFPWQLDDPLRPDPRSKSLKYGMLLGLYAGGLMLSRFRENHYYEFIQGQLVFDSSTFSGYHIDAESIVQATDPLYVGLGSVITLPKQKTASLDEALEAGVGIIATHTLEYRRQFASQNVFRVVFGHDKDKKAIKAELKDMRSREFITPGDFL